VESYTEHQVLCLENKFKEFKAHIYWEPNYRKMIEAMDDCISFDEAWSMIGTQCPSVCDSFGGLASVFPGASTVELDFSVIGYEKDNYRTAFTNFSLEGILQCKQFDVLGKMNTML
jgi:hypothetical protein